ncbi:uncharacterized protein LOC101846908 [Aplysia californica]|uniref:Uncharacterized protein LOC101846908 n=1 Tax=Aplysia californica TaxID=6500 RepID=A0ABM0K0W6_APLCA|nr:uncharacterized protein LOC101846908 [Aplysia californica]
MFACCCSPMGRKERDGQTILDIEQILQDYVWNDFLSVLGRVQRKCVRRKNYVIEVPMNFFHLEEEQKPVVLPRVHISDLDNQDIRHRHVMNEIHRRTGNGTTSGMAQSEEEEKKKKKKKKNVPRDKNNSEIFTDYVNDTPTEQTYKFRLEKTRKSSLTATVQRGFTVGTKTNFTVGLPKLTGGSKVGTEFDLRFTVTKTNSDLCEETVTFETTSDIKVKEGNKYVAKVVLEETEVSYNFWAWTRLSLPNGSAPTVVRRKSDNKECHNFQIKNLKEAFEDYKELVTFKSLPANVPLVSKDKKKMSPEEKNAVTYAVVIESRGIIDGTRLSDQHISLKAHNLVQHSKSTQVTNGVVDEDHEEENGAVDEEEEECEESEGEEEEEEEEGGGKEMVEVAIKAGGLSSSSSTHGVAGAGTPGGISATCGGLTSPLLPVPTSKTSTPV